MGSLRKTGNRTDPTNTTMSLDLYTRNIPLTQKARFWGNYVSALKGNADLCAAPEPRVTHWYPSITEAVPPTYPGLRHEFGKLESLQRSQRATTCPPTRVCQMPMIGSTPLVITTAPYTPRYTVHTGTRPGGAARDCGSLRYTDEGWDLERINF